MHSSHKPNENKVGLRKFSLKMAAKSKEKVCK